MAGGVLGSKPCRVLLVIVRSLAFNMREMRSHWRILSGGMA